MVSRMLFAALCCLSACAVAPVVVKKEAPARPDRELAFVEGEGPNNDSLYVCGQLAQAFTRMTLDHFVEYQRQRQAERHGSPDL